jgi:hypothetical protein
LRERRFDWKVTFHSYLTLHNAMAPHITGHSTFFVKPCSTGMYTPSYEIDLEKATCSCSCENKIWGSKFTITALPSGAVHATTVRTR